MGPGLGYFLLPAGGALSLTGVITGNGTLISLSWIMWVLGILLILGNRYRRPADPRAGGRGRRRGRPGGTGAADARPDRAGRGAARHGRAAAAAGGEGR